MVLDRSATLPERVMHGGIHFSEVSLDEHRPFFAGEKAHDYLTNAPIDRGTHVRLADQAVTHFLERGDHIDEIIDTLKSADLSRGETVHLIYPWRHSDNINLIPLALAHSLESIIPARIEQDSQLSSLELAVAATPIFQSNRNYRKNINAFEKLVARSSFEPPDIKGSALVVEDDVFTGMSMAEVHSAVVSVPEINLLGIMALISYDGGHRFRIHPDVKRALIESLDAEKTPAVQSGSALFENTIRKIGFPTGINGLTNMEALYLIASLYEGETARRRLEELWTSFSDTTLSAINAKMIANDYDVWRDDFTGAEFIDRSSSDAPEVQCEHIILRVADSPKISLAQGIEDIRRMAVSRIPNFRGEKDDRSEQSR